MKVIIDIPENDYELACNHPDALIACYAHYIKAGVPLHKWPEYSPATLGDLPKTMSEEDIVDFLERHR
jgi:hypothetical protein